MGGACSCDDAEEEYTIVVRQVPVIAPKPRAPSVPLGDDAPPRSYSAIAEFPTPPSPLTLDAQFEEVEF